MTGGSAQRQLIDALARFTVHDASAPISPDAPTWFRYDRMRIRPTLSLDSDGAAANVLEISEHAGTHVDAPSHTVRDGLPIDRVPVDRLFMKPFKKYDLQGMGPQPGEVVGLDALRECERQASFTLGPGDVAVIQMGWDRHRVDDGAAEDWWGRNQPGLSEQACAYFAESGVVAVASDTGGCDVACRDAEVAAAHGHRTYFLPNDILILEGLYGLSRVGSVGLMVALPLRIRDGTASPVRVLLLTENP